jgi:hypothetical protein
MDVRVRALGGCPLHTVCHYYGDSASVARTLSQEVSYAANLRQSHLVRKHSFRNPALHVLTKL